MARFEQTSAGRPLSCAAAAMLPTTSVAAQDTPGKPHTVATATISQPVMYTFRQVAR